MTARDGQQRRLTIGICTIVVAIAFEAIAVATVMPAAARDLDGLPYYAWSFSLFLIGMLFATVLAGRLADRIGPAKPLIVGMAVFAAGLVVAGTAQLMAQLVAGRAVQGLGSGAMNTAIFVFVATSFAPRDRPRVFTFISTAWVLPSFLGPPAAAWLTDRLSWHWVFFAVLPLLAGGAVMMAPTLAAALRSAREAGSEPSPSGAPPAAIWAAALVAFGAAAIQVAGQVAGQQLRWWALVPLAAGFAALLIGLPRLMPPGFLRLGRGLSAVILVRGLLPGAFFGGEAFVPLMLVELRGLDLLRAGAVLTVGAVGWTTGSWLQSRPWLRLRRDRLITIGCGCVALGLAVVGGTALASLWVGLVGVGWVVGGLGMGLSVSSTSLAVITLSPIAVQGRNAASLNLFDALGSAVIVGAGGTLFVALHATGRLELTFGAILLTMALLAALSALVSLRVGVIRNELG